MQDTKQIPAPVPETRIGKSLLTIGELCIKNTIAIIDIVQIQTLTYAIINIERLSLLCSIFSII